MTGAPEGAGNHGIPLNLSAPLVAMARHTSSWSAPRMLTQNRPVASILG